MRSLCFALLCLLPGLASAAVPLGMKLEDGALVDVTTEGFDALEGAVDNLVPSQIEVPPIDVSDRSGCNSVTGCLYAYSVYSDDLQAFVDLTQVDLQPAPGRLNLAANASVRVNSAGVPGTLDYAGELIYINFSGTCDVWVRPIDVRIDAAIDLTLVPDPAGVDVDGDGQPDTKRLDADVDTITWSWDASSEDIQIAGCPGLGTLIDVLDFFTLDIRQIVLNQVGAQIDALVAGLPAQLEPLIEEAFAGLVLSQQLDLLGRTITITAWPDRLDLDTPGMRVGMSTVVDTEIDPCMAPYGITGSVQTPGDPPGLDHPDAALEPPHAVVMADDDLLNHILFGVWATGALCLDLGAEDSPVQLPFALDTNLLSVLAGKETFAHLFPEPAPLGLVTDPREPPLARFGGPHDIDVIVDPVGLRVTAEVDGRIARLLNVDLAAEIGADVLFDPTTGLLDVVIDADADDIATSVTYNEFAPETSERVRGAFGAILSTAADPLLSSLPEISLPLPAIEGLGVTDLVTAPTGAKADHLGLYAAVGEVPYKSAAGCDTSGCAGGCTATSSPAALWWLWFPVSVALVRRRR